MYNILDPNFCWTLFILSKGGNNKKQWFFTFPFSEMSSSSLVSTSISLFGEDPCLTRNPAEIVQLPVTQLDSHKQ